MEISLIIFGLAGLLVLVCFLTPLASLLKIPFSFALLIAGAVVGYLVHAHGWAAPGLAEFLDALKTFEIPSETILVIFLPVLLFEAALAINVRGLISDLAPIMLLAVVAVFVCTLFVGWGVSLVSTQSLAVCLLMGAIVATTDPAAVIGIFKEVGAPKRLSTIVEGESLLNDAAAIALYTVLIAIAAQGSATQWSFAHVLGNFGVLLVGGALAGYCIGRLTCAAFALLRGWPTAEISLSVATAYIAYIVPEHYLGVSGVVSTVVAGLVISTVGRTRITTKTFHAMAQSWHQMGFWASSLIFLFAAMMIPSMLVNATWEHVFIVVVMLMAALLARIVTVFALMPVVTAGAGTKVSNAYKVVIAWGGLRGALSLALALSVTEHASLSREVSSFVAIGATGFVLGTLLVNGVTLRPLIRLLGLNQLSRSERALGDQVVTVTTALLQQEVEKMAIEEQISRPAREKISGIFTESIEQTQLEHRMDQFTQDEKVKLGLVIAARREFELLFNSMGEQGVDTRVADRLLALTESMEDNIKDRGLEGFFASVERTLGYSWAFKFVMRMHYHFSVPRLLGHKLSQRFMLLIVMRWVTRSMINFSDTQLQPMLGEDVSAQITAAQRKRLALIEKNLQAMRLQYPKYAEWLEQTYLGRAARSMEQARYRQMLDSSLITSEVYDTLAQELGARWRFLDEKPALDVELAPDVLVRQVPVLRDLPPENLGPLAKHLKSRLALPDQLIMKSNRNHAQSMYFVASGAVSLRLPDATHIELGSGEFFGELQLLGHDLGNYEVRSMGYTKLLELSPKEFRHAWRADQQLRTVVERVAAERVKAIKAWKEHLNSDKKE